MAEIHAFVKLLRRAHGALCREAQFARGLLLQGGSREGRRRVAAALLLLDRKHFQTALRLGLQRRVDFRGARAIVDGKLLELFTVEMGEPGDEVFALGGQIGFDGPVLARLKGFDLHLALDDQAQRRTLHAPGRQAAAHLFPQQRREVEAHQVVERATRLLRVDEVLGQLARLLDRMLDRALGDFVKLHAMYRFVVQHVFRFQNFMQVPGDGFALAIRVGRQIQRVGLFHGLDDGIHVLFIFLDQHVLHAEVVLRVHRALFREQVTHMAVRGQAGKILAQILGHGFGLGRRFHHNQMF